MRQEPVHHLVEPVRVPAVPAPYTFDNQMHRFRSGKAPDSDSTVVIDRGRPLNTNGAPMPDSAGKG